MVAPQILVLLVGVRILPGEYAEKPLKIVIFRGFRLVEQPMLSFGPFVYRLGHEILNLKRRVRFP